MVGGMATVAGVMAGYVASVKFNAGTLLARSIMAVISRINIS